MNKFLLQILQAVLEEILAPFFSYQLGREKKENEQNKASLQNIKKAADARNKLNSDDGYAARLRRKFTR